MLPTPSSLKSAIRPSCASTTCRAMARPSPWPPVRPFELRRAAEPVEDPPPVLLRDPRTLVAHREPGPPAAGTRGDGDLAATRREAHGIRQEVADGPGQGLGVSDDDRPRVQSQGQPQTPLGGEDPRLLDGLPREQGQVDLLLDERSGSHARHGEEVLEEAGHPPRRPVDHRRRPGALLRRHVVAGEHGVDVGLHDGDGVAQLVRDVVDEVALAPVKAASMR